MNAIDEVNIAVARRPRKHGVARGCPQRLRGQIAGAEIGFNFNNAPGKLLAALFRTISWPSSSRETTAWIAIKNARAQKLEICRGSYRSRLHVSKPLLQSAEKGFPASDRKRHAQEGRKRQAHAGLSNHRQRCGGGM